MPSTTPGSMIVAPASFRSSTARMNTCTISGSVRVALVGEAQHADARALQAVADEGRRVVLRQMCGRGCARRPDRRDRCRRRPGRRRRRRSTRARHRPGDVGEQVERHHARPARQSHRRSNADERLMRGRPADRVAGVAAEADGAEARGDRGGGAAARSRGDAIERVRILRVAGQDRAERLVRRERPLGHVRLGDARSRRRP